MVSLTDPGCVETRFCYDSTGESAEAGMAGFIQGVDRAQATLLPEYLEDWAVNRRRTVLPAQTAATR